MHSSHLGTFVCVRGLTRCLAQKVKRMLGHRRPTVWACALPGSTSATRAASAFAASACVHRASSRAAPNSACAAAASARAAAAAAVTIRSKAEAACSCAASTADRTDAAASHAAASVSRVAASAARAPSNSACAAAAAALAESSWARAPAPSTSLGLTRGLRRRSCLRRPRAPHAEPVVKLHPAWRHGPRRCTVRRG